MLTVQDAFGGATTKIGLASGDVLRMGLVIPGDAGPFTCARVLVVGDLLRRVVEDVYSGQVLAAIVSNDRWVAEQDWESTLSVRPVIGKFSNADKAETALGHSLDCVVTVAEAYEQLPIRSATITVAPVHAMVPYPGADPTTMRFAITSVHHKYRLQLTSPLLERSHTVLQRWRDQITLWSRQPGHPIPPAWREAVIAAVDDDLDVAAVVSLMGELDDDEGVEPGAKFEAFTYVDRLLAVDLGRGLGCAPPQRTDYCPMTEPTPGHRRSRRRRGRSRHPVGSPRTVHEYSAGGLVIDGLDHGNPAVALIRTTTRRGHTRWTVPKGHIEIGETAEQTAIREIAEETGIYGEVLAPLGVNEYWFNAQDQIVHKTVHHYLLRFVNGELRTDDHEVVDVAWVPLDELGSRCSHADERELGLIAARLVDILRAHGPAALPPLPHKAPRRQPQSHSRAGNSAAPTAPRTEAGNRGAGQPT